MTETQRRGACPAGKPGGASRPHRAASDVVPGDVAFHPVKGLWFLGMLAGAVAGAVFFFSFSALLLFLVSTAIVLLFGHSLGSHRKLVHDSYQCPRWLEYTLVYLGVQVGLAGPIGLLRQHELRDYAQRLPVCHDYLRHGRAVLDRRLVAAVLRVAACSAPREIAARSSASPPIASIAGSSAPGWRSSIPWAILFYCWGGWAFVCWGVCARVTAGVFGHWIIGYLAHNHGDMERVVVRRRRAGPQRPLHSLLTMGECWHNNHHAFPGSARLGLRPGRMGSGLVGVVRPRTPRPGVGNPAARRSSAARRSPASRLHPRAAESHERPRRQTAFPRLVAVRRRRRSSDSRCA